MPSRIDIGPDTGPFVELDEENGEFVIRVPEDEVNFDQSDLRNVKDFTAESVSTESLANVADYLVETTEGWNQAISEAGVGERVHVGNVDLTGCDPWDMPANSTLSGQGQFTTLLTMADNQDRSFIRPGDGCVIRDIGLDQNVANQSAGNGVDFHQVTSGICQNVHVQWTHVHAFTSNQSSDILFKGCSAERFGDDGFEGSNDGMERVRVIGCSAINGGEDADGNNIGGGGSSFGFEFDDGGGGVVVSGCVSYNNGDGGFHLGKSHATVTGATSDIVGSGLLSVNDGTGILVGDQDNDDPVKNVSVSGFTVIRGDVNIINGAKNVSISGGTIEMADGQTHAIHHDSSAVDNSISDVAITLPSGRGADYGVRISNGEVQVSDVTVHDEAGTLGAGSFRTQGGGPHRLTGCKTVNAQRPYRFDVETRMRDCKVGASVGTAVWLSDAGASGSSIVDCEVGGGSIFSNADVDDILIKDCEFASGTDISMDNGTESGWRLVDNDWEDAIPDVTFSGEGGHYVQDNRPVIPVDVTSVLAAEEGNRGYNDGTMGAAGYAYYDGEAWQVFDSTAL